MLSLVGKNSCTFMLRLCLWSFPYFWCCVGSIKKDLFGSDKTRGLIFTTTITRAWSFTSVGYSRSAWFSSRQGKLSTVTSAFSLFGISFLHSLASFSCTGRCEMTKSSTLQCRGSDRTPSEKLQSINSTKLCPKCRHTCSLATRSKGNRPYL